MSKVVIEQQLSGIDLRRVIAFVNDARRQIRKKIRKKDYLGQSYKDHRLNLQIGLNQACMNLENLVAMNAGSPTRGSSIATITAGLVINDLEVIRAYTKLCEMCLSIVYADA